ncbi:MAG: glycosyltransferase family 4 protein [Gallionellaceae bacterium]
MKILFVGTHNGGGGTESHLVTLSKAMSEAGHDVAAVIRFDTPIHKGLVGSKVALFQGVFRNAFDPRGIVAVWRAVSEFKPDWIVGSFSKEYWPLAVIARLRGVKLALFKHMDYPLRFFTHHFIPRLAHRFIVISEYMRRNFIARGVDATRIDLLYNPIDLNHFQPNPALRKKTRYLMGFADSDVVIGYIGAMHPDKGMIPLCDAINQAMAEAPSLKALWIGEGLALEELKTKFQDGGFASQHTWHTWSANVLPYFEAIDMLAMPTIGNEAFGRVSIEAQACGLPVLCSNNGGLPETLQPNITGLLLPPGDVPAWRDAILKLAKDTQLRTQLSSKGRDWVNSTFSTTAIAQEFTRLLEETK